MQKPSHRQSLKFSSERFRSVLIIVAALYLGVKFNAAAAITLNTGGITALEVVARDTQISFANTIGNLSPTAVPYDQSTNAVVGVSSSFALFHLGEDNFSLTSSGARAGQIDSRANVQPLIYFSPSTDTAYSISGTLTVSDPAASGKAVQLTATLTDVGTAAVLYNSQQESFGVVDQSFTLGGMAGNVANMLSGSATGVLLAGHQYSIFFGSSIYAANSGDPASFLGSFDLEFTAVPEPSVSVMLLGLVLVALRRGSSATHSAN